MKKLFAFAAVMCCITCVCMALVACGQPHIDEISIVAPSSTVIRAGESFTLEYTTVPEEAAEKINVNWEISDSCRLSYKDGKFTALTCGTVKVTARVKGNDATDEIELKVTAPEGFLEYTGTGCSLVYPLDWSPSANGSTMIWTAGNGTSNMNFVTEALNKSYYSATASSFQAVLASTYELLGYTVNFTQPTKVNKAKYLGVERVQVDYLYSLTKSGATVSIHQTQMIINNVKENLSCVLTITFREEDFDDAAMSLQETVLSQFMPV